MLTELYIRNFAIIDELRLTLTNGFNVLTGETGAGKSIILDAIMLILGGRADRSMIRAETKGATIEATFAMDDELRERLESIFSAEEIDMENELTIGRELKASGTTVSRVNGSRVGTKILQKIGEHLIDIHGQGSHLNLLRPASHLPLLDSYAGTVSERLALSKVVGDLRKLQQELNDLRQDERLIAQRIDILSFQVNEIDAAALIPGEEDDLRSERTRLGSAEQLMKFSAEAVHLLNGSDDGENEAVTDMLGQAERALTGLARLDETQNPLLERLQGLVFELSEVASEIDDYQNGLEFNPERLNEVEERLELINTLKRKYGDGIEQILAYRDEKSAELDKFENSTERAEQLEREINKGLKKVGGLSAELSKKRKESADRLAFTVERELRDLRMTARFQVDFQTAEDENGAYVGDQRLAFDHTGTDKIEFLLSTNPGEPLKPMAKVASGGETARIMLSLKTALAQVDETPTLIFDEIDQGIGGRIGDTVGRKLWGLTAVGDHQVIVVTHLPQLAGYGDRHFHVRKQVNEGRTRTFVTELERDERILELASMIGTDNTHARGGAAAILDNAAQVKARVAANRA